MSGQVIQLFASPPRSSISAARSCYTWFTLNAPLTHVADARKRRLILLTIAAGTFVSVLDQTGVSLALPLMANEFDATIPFVQWVALGYILTTGALLLPAGRLSDLVGRKVVYVAGFCVFVIGAGLAASAPNLMAVIGFRIIQGAGSALIQANGMAILTTTFPAQQRGRVIGMFMTMVGLGAIMGPILAGLVVDTFGWRSVFVASVPLGGISLIAAVGVLTRDSPTVRSFRQLATRFDWAGALFSASGLAIFLLVMTNAYHLGWTSPIVVTALTASICLLVAFVYWERRTSQPMLELELFRRRTFALGTSASFFGFLAGTAVFSMMPFYLQDVLDLSPRAAGMFIAPAALGFALSGPLAGRLADSFGPRRIEFAGLGMLGASLIFLGTLTVDTSPAVVAAAMALQGLGMGVFYTPNTASVLSVVEQSKYGIATAFLNMTRNTANVVGIGLAITIVTITMASRGFEPSLDAVAAGGAGVEAAFTDGLRIAFLLLGAFIGASILLTVLKSTAREHSVLEASGVAEPKARIGGD